MNIMVWADQAPAIMSGLFAASCLTIGPMFRSRHMILLAQLGAGLGFAAHYGFLGIPVAAAIWPW